MPRRLVLSLLIAGAVLFASLSFLSLSSVGANASVPASTTTGVISPQRVPALLADATADSVVRADINNAVATGRGGQSCVAVNRDGRVVANTAGTAALVPASTLKLLTATAALDVYAVDDKFKTAVKALDGPKNGVITGSLYLVGGGDPLLFTNDYAKALNHPNDPHTSLETLADSVVKAGVKVVHGNVVGDDTLFDKQRYLPSWEPAYQQQGQIGPIGALQVNQGFGRFVGGRVPSVDPATQAADALTNLLKQRGVQVDGAPSDGVTPQKAGDVASIESAGVGAIVSEMLTESDNSTAEVMLRNIGVKASGAGTFAAGTDAVKAVAAKDGIPMSGVVVVDGSGLDRSDRATCPALLDALVHDGPRGVIASALPKAGQSGTLSDRMKGTAAVGRVAAKTGTLANVSTLAGWVTPPSGSPFAFAIMSNGVSTDTGRAFEDSLAETFAALPATPDSVAYALH